MELDEGGGCFTSATCLGGTPPITSAPLPVFEDARAIVLPKPVKIWSVAVLGKNATDTPKEVIEQVGPTMVIRINGIKHIHGCEAVVRIPSVEEKEKIMSDAKYVKSGLMFLL